MNQRRDIEPTLLCDGRIAYGVVWDLGVTVFGPFRWTPSIAKQYADECIALTESASVLGGRGGLTYLMGDPPGAGERRVIVDALHARGVDVAGQRTVIVTDSAMVRGAATALAWLTGGQTFTYATRELDAAARWTAFGDVGLGERVAAHARRGLEMVRS